MQALKTIVPVVGVLALGAAAPALAGSDRGNGTPPTNQGTAHKQAAQTHPAKTKAYGHYCQGQSKKHVKGTKGTPFSQCVTAMAKVAHSQATPKQACST